MNLVEIEVEVGLEGKEQKGEWNADTVPIPSISYTFYGVLNYWAFMVFMVCDLSILPY